MSKAEEADTAVKTDTITSSKFASGLPDVAAVERLSSCVTRVLGMNPGPFTLTGTNTYIVGTGSERILIDTGEGREEYPPLLLKQLEGLDATIATILITHHHYDHAGGIEQVQAFYDTPISVYKHVPAGQEHGDFKHIADGDTFTVEGATLRAVYTPGHTQDHMSFVLEEETALFTGDCVLGCGSAVFENLRVYLQSLEVLAKLSPRRLYPGHGPVVDDGLDKIKAYISHRLLREKQVLKTLELPALAAGGSCTAIATEMYKSEGIPDHLLPAAAKSVRLHCGKLLEEGKIVLVGEANEESPASEVFRLATSSL